MGIYCFGMAGYRGGWIRQRLGFAHDWIFSRGYKGWNKMTDNM
jgi:hypothetical protein